MANYNRDWDRNRMDRSNDDHLHSRFDEENYDNRRRERSDNYDRREMRGLDHNQEKNWGRSNRRDDYYSGSNDSNRRDSDYNRGMYGNSTGVNRGSSNYLDANDSNDWRYNTGRNYMDDSSRRGYAGSDYGDFGRRHMEDRNEDRDWWDKTKDEVSSWFGDDEAARRRRMDEQREARHKGRGPKGYTRSDERIKEDVNDRLTDDPHIDASNIEVSVQSCEVVLTGTVDSRFAKRHAEDIADSVTGVNNGENRLRDSRGSPSW